MGEVVFACGLPTDLTGIQAVELAPFSFLIFPVGTHGVRMPFFMAGVKTSRARDSLWDVSIFVGTIQQIRFGGIVSGKVERKGIGTEGEWLELSEGCWASPV